MKKVLLSFVLLIVFISNAFGNTEVINALKEGGKLVFIRHAYAPGGGDPENFNINDCSTQRNLNSAGIEQAKQIGKIFKDNNIPIAQVLSSEWCRCRDTATEMDIGRGVPFAGLNSFFDGHVDRAATLATLRNRMQQIEAGQLVLMVTHQVVISAITGIAPRSGGIIAYNSRTGSARRITLP